MKEIAMFLPSCLLFQTFIQDSNCFNREVHLSATMFSINSHMYQEMHSTQYKTTVNFMLMFSPETFITAKYNRTN